MSSTACDDQLIAHPDEQPKRHKWADVIIAWANGEEIECQSDNGSFWFVPEMYNPVINHGLEWRIKPRTIKIGDMEVPEPLREAPLLGTRYYVANPLGVDLAIQFDWYGDRNDKDFLARGSVHIIKESAIAHARALIAISGGTV